MYNNRGKFVKNVGFLILNSFKMLARFSKSDFWIPEQISDYKNIFSKNIIFSSLRKVSRNFRNLENVVKFLEFVGFSMGFRSKFTKETHSKSNKFLEFPHFFKISKFSRYFSPR